MKPGLQPFSFSDDFFKLEKANFSKMKTLSETWFADGYIDFELKKYTLLAYLQKISANFDRNRLYPDLADLIFHYNNLQLFKKNKELLKEQFPKKLTGIQIEKLQLIYEQMIEDDEIMQELEDIIRYSSRKMKDTIKTGTEIFDIVENNMEIFPIGIVPLENREGYFLLVNGSSRNVRAYYYQLGIIERHDEKYKSIKTEFISEWMKSIVYTYEHIKSELIKMKKEIPNPAVYGIESKLSFPVEETTLPVAKRSLVRHISVN